MQPVRAQHLLVTALDTVGPAAHAALRGKIGDEVCGGIDAVSGIIVFLLDVPAGVSTIMSKTIPRPNGLIRIINFPCKTSVGRLSASVISPVVNFSGFAGRVARS